jgi:TP901 family phage tail tape measure protein
MASFIIPVRIDAKGVTKGLNNISSKFKTFGKNLTLGVTLPLAGIATAASRMALGFDESLTKVNTLVGISKSELEGMRGEIMQLAGESARSPQELAEALFTVTSAGLRGKEAMDVLNMAAKSSASGLGETRSVAQALTGIMQSYAKSGMTAQQATDILTATVRAGNLEASELAPVLGRVTGIASQLGIGFDEVGASIATFTRLGVNSAEAVTGLSGIMNGLLKPTEQTHEALATIGMSMDDLRASVKERGLAATLTDLVAKVGDNQDVMGKLIPNVRALSAVLGTAGAQGEAYIEVANEISNSTGLADKVFQDTAKSASFQFKKSLNSLAVIGTEIGSMLLPPIVKAAEFVGNLVKSFMNLDGSMKTIILGLGAVAMAIGPLITALGFIISPIGLIIGSIVGLTVLIQKNFDSIIGFTVEVINGFIDLYNSSLLVRKGVEGIKFIAKTVFNFLKTGILSVIDIFKSFGNIIKLIFQRRFDEIPDLIRGTFEKIKGDANEFGEQVGDDFAEGVQNTLSGKMEHVTKEGVVAGLNNAVEGVKGTVANIGKKVSEILGIGSLGGSEVSAKIEEENKVIEKTLEKRAETLDEAKDKFSLTADQMSDLTAELNSTLGQGIGDMLSGLAEGIASGDNLMKSFIQMIGGFFVQIGKMLISFGFAQMAFLESLKSMNPFALIAAGTALVLIGSLIRATMKNKAKELEGGGVTAFAKGGIVTGPTLGLVGEAGPEAIIPLDRLGQIMGQQKGEFVLRGNDLVLAMERAKDFRSRITG